MQTDYRTRLEKRLLGLLIATFFLLAPIFGLPPAARAQQHQFGPFIEWGANSTAKTLTAATPTLVSNVAPVYNPRATGTEQVLCVGVAEVDTGASASSVSIQITSTLGNSNPESLSIPASSKGTLLTIAAMPLSQANSGAFVDLEVTDSNADTVPVNGSSIICAGFAE